MKPKLLVIELWGLGDLVIATPFLQAASQRFDVTLLAKPYARDLQPRFWPEVSVHTFIAPWTAFKHKYRLLSWPWRHIWQLRSLAAQRFDIGLSARWDPRDHFLLKALQVNRRLGFPRLRSELFLTEPLLRPAPTSHRFENWRVLAKALELEVPERHRLPITRPLGRTQVLVHTGAGQPVRVWPLERYQGLVKRLRDRGCTVQVASDPDQRNWWLNAGETGVVTPQSVTELLRAIDTAGAFIGNDSGPSHLAGFSGVPTFTLFGPQLPDWFAPLHPHGECLEGKPCPYKPCSDYCRFPVPFCMGNVTEDEVWLRVEKFLNRLFA